MLARQVNDGVGSKKRGCESTPKSATGIHQQLCSHWTMVGERVPCGGGKECQLGACVRCAPVRRRRRQPFIRAPDLQLLSRCRDSLLPLARRVPFVADRWPARPLSTTHPSHHNSSPRSRPARPPRLSFGGNSRVAARPTSGPSAHRAKRVLPPPTTRPSCRLIEFSLQHFTMVYACGVLDCQCIGSKRQLIDWLASSLCSRSYVRADLLARRNRAARLYTHAHARHHCHHTAHFQDER